MSTLQPLQERWLALAERERWLVASAAALVAGALVWTIAVQPAWRTVRSAPQERARLEAQLQTMQRQAAETKVLRATAPLAPGLALAALQGATTRLGTSGKLSVQGDRAVLTLTAASGEALAQWLVDARRGARARPVEAKLVNDGSGYSGTVVVTIGGRS